MLTTLNSLFSNTDEVSHGSDYHFQQTSDGGSIGSGSPVSDEQNLAWGDDTLSYSSHLYNSHGSDSRSEPPYRKTQQRTAANQRERKRMKSINDAFENLKESIPLPLNERKKLSKVETLKYAIAYIGNMTEILQQYEDTLYYRKKKHSEKPKKVTIRSRKPMEICNEKGRNSTGSCLRLDKVW